MTAHIDPLQPPTPRRSHAGPVAPIGRSGDFALALSRAEKLAAPNSALPPTPPPELGAHIAAAARAWESLAAAGRHVSFEHGDDGRLTVSVHDADGAQGESVGLSALFDLIDREGGV